MVVTDDAAATEGLRELVVLAAAEDLYPLELAVFEQQRRLSAVGVVRLLRPHLQRHGAFEERVVFDTDLGALVEVLVTVTGKGVGDSRVHAGAEQRAQACSREVVVKLHLLEERLVDRLGARLARGHVLIVRSGGQTGSHDLQVVLWDHGVHEQAAALGGLRQRRFAGGVKSHRRRLAAADLVGHEAGPFEVVVAEDDL